jgi:peptidoglycan hydrolase-like protein with peptidoglycan-binding domain
VTTAERRRRRRVPAVAVGGVAVLAAGAAVAAGAGFGGGSGGAAPPPANLPPGTAHVTRETMLDTDEEPGELGFAGQVVLAGRVPGVVTRIPLPGAVFTRGQAVYRVDDRPVVLFYGPVAAYRDLGPGTEGRDVRQLEAGLYALGYRGFTVDDTYSSATATAVREWQDDVGLAETGRVELGRVLFAQGPIRVASVAAGVNESTGGGQEVLRYTGTGRQVTVTLDVSKQRLARAGIRVVVRLPDGKEVPGRVERVTSVVQQASQDADPETKIQAIVRLTDDRAAAGIEAAFVSVVFTAGERKDVLGVPVQALVALAEGGYGLEVVDGSSTRFLPVRTGLFANGRVEVAGDGVREGLTVGMPS